MPSVEGKFFYADFKKTADDHYAAYIKLGDESDGELPIWVTTQEYSLAAITDGCKRCSIDKPWTNRFTPSNTVKNYVPISEAILLSDESLNGTKLNINIFDG